MKKNHHKDAIISTFDYSKYLTFYQIMKYPVPRDFQYFLFEKELKEKPLLEKEHKFSRNKKNPYMDEYIHYIDKFGRLYKSIPFVKEIYLCNSITFNALKEDSDIDLFIITKKWKIRLARFFSVLMFSVLWLKRSLKNKNKKFCLSFYVTEDAKNLYGISLSQLDVYLMYWISHLVPLYVDDNLSYDIVRKNSWYRSLLPNFPDKFVINIWNTLFTWRTFIKRFFEFILWWWIGMGVQELIKLIRIPIVSKKRKELWDAWWGVVIKNDMLKFHKDMRKKIHLLFKLSRQAKIK